MTALGLSVCISMAAAVSLGMTRFAYALLLPPMRDDLLWSYTLAGAMNTFNAVGYLVGALITPWALRRWGTVRVLIWGALAATIFMALTGFLIDTAALLFQRFLAGVASAAVFCLWWGIGGPPRCTNSCAIRLVVGCVLRRNGLGYRLVCAYGACLIGLGTSAGG